MKFKTLLFILIASPVFSQDIKESELRTSINEVTVFLQGAQITRTGKTIIKPGKSTLIIKSLSPHLDDKSIRVKANGNFTILSVNHKFNYLNELTKDNKVDSLSKKIEALDSKISDHKSRLEVLKEKQSLLNENKNLGGVNMKVSLTQLKDAIEFYDKELSSIKSEELKILLEIKELDQEKLKTQKQISEVSNENSFPSSEIEVKVESDSRTDGNFTITYLVANAGWFPKYDVRVENIEKPINLKYKASVYQNTGIDWDNVKLKFSNGNPNQSGVAPKLDTWYLNYARNTIYSRRNLGMEAKSFGNISGKVLNEEGEPVPGANVIINGTTVGTVTDLKGNYALTLPNNAQYLTVSYVGYTSQELPISSSMINVQLQDDVQELSEVVVTGYSTDKLYGSTPGVRIRGASSIRRGSKNLKAETITTNTVENQTTVEFEVEEPYSMKSNGEKLSVDLKQYDIDAIYEYYAVPKLEKDAFLIARITNWDQYNLLEGEANLYFEDAYVGRSVLDAKLLTDTLNISLGRDKNIVIGRIKHDEYTRRRKIGSNNIENVGFKIIARNKKSQPIKLTIFDQIPVSSINDIIINPNELSNGKLTEKTGEVIWELNLARQQQTELLMKYEVKYPKREKVILE